jgi:hypothetical protein
MTIQTFRAGPNGVTEPDGVPYETYTPIQGRTDFVYTPAPGQTVAGYDTGNEWDNVKFIWRPAPGPIEAIATAWVLGFGAPQYVNNNAVISVFKNGIDYSAELGGAFVNTFANTAWVTNHFMDVAVAGDEYQFMLFMTTPGGPGSVGIIQKDPRHTKILGRSFGS